MATSVLSLIIFAIVFLIIGFIPLIVFVAGKRMKTRGSELIGSVLIGTAILLFIGAVFAAAGLTQATQVGLISLG